MAYSKAKITSPFSGFLLTIPVCIRHTVNPQLFSHRPCILDENQKRQAFTQHWLEAEPSVSAYAFASISGFHDAEDVVQRIAQELARRFDEYDSSRPFVGWALWIAKSRVIDFYRAQGRERVIFSKNCSVSSRTQSQIRLTAGAIVVKRWKPVWMSSRQSRAGYSICGTWKNCQPKSRRGKSVPPADRFEFCCRASARCSQVALSDASPWRVRDVRRR